MLPIVLWCVFTFSRDKWEENSWGKWFTDSFVWIIKGSEKFGVALLLSGLSRSAYQIILLLCVI
jgi:hypothetical protein